MNYLNVNMHSYDEDKTINLQMATVKLYFEIADNLYLIIISN